MPNPLDDFVLPTDLPTSFSQNTIDSDSSLKPAPLNFSRPRPRPEPSHETRLDRTSDQSKASAASPAVAAAPSPIVARTDNPYDFAFGYDRNGNNDDDDNDNENDSDDSDDAAPPPVVRTSSSTQESPYYTLTSNRGNSHGPSSTWIYKPYASRHARDDASSVLTDIPEYSEDDASSIAESTSTGYSSVSDFARNGQFGWNARINTQAERWVEPTPRRQDGRGVQSVRTNSGSSNGSASTTHIAADSDHDLSGLNGSSQSVQPSRQSSRQPLVSTRSSNSAHTASSNTSTSSGSSAPPIPIRIPRIIKHTELDQMSEHVSLAEEGTSDSGSLSSSEWRSSDFDTSDLTVAQIHKLKKKGINPSLYAEMQQARNGNRKNKKFRIGALTGNTFLG